MPIQHQAMCFVNLDKSFGPVKPLHHGVSQTPRAQNDNAAAARPLPDANRVAPAGRQINFGCGVGCPAEHYEIIGGFPDAKHVGTRLVIRLSNKASSSARFAAGVSASAEGGASVCRR